MTDNPLMQVGFPVAFDRIQPGHVEPAITALIEQARERLEAIASVPGPRTWDNTMRALDEMTDPLDRALSVVRHIESVATTPEHRAVYNKVEPLASAFYSRIPLHDGLWRALLAYSETDEARQLLGAQRRFLDKTLQAFRRHGAGGVCAHSRRG